MDYIRVMVTGAGSGVGQGIIKSLNISDHPLTIISADISPLNSALYRTDESVLIPKVEDEGSLQIMCDIIKKNNIHVVMIGSEYDLMFFSENKEKIFSETGAMVIVSPVETVQIADDKWKTVSFFQDNGLPYAEAFLPGNITDAVRIAAEWKYPIILKPRSGTSSRHVHVVKNASELADIWPSVPGPMLQKMIETPSQELENEYTCSIFKTAQGNILGPFYARRTLRGGTSWHVEVDEFPLLYDLLMGIGEKIEFEGSLNVQLMMSDDGPVPFELNARFSGTTAIRAYFGFNEPAMAIQSYYLGEEPKNPLVGKGVALRYHEEVFINDVTAQDVRSHACKGVIPRWY